MKQLYFLPSLKLTVRHLPTIDFQGRLLLVSGNLQGGPPSIDEWGYSTLLNLYGLSPR